MKFKYYYILLILLLITSNVLAAIACSNNEILNEFLKEAPSLKDSAVQKSVDPKYTVNAQIDGYTEEPKEIGHYHEEKSDTAKMQQEAARMTKPDVEENPKENAGQAVIQSFKKRPVYKLTWDDPDIKKAKHAEDHPEEHVKLDVSSKTNCEKKKTTKCEETFSEKTCNEQVRALVKTCEKVPKITTSIKNTVYPNCTSVVVAQIFRGGCPAGYGSIADSDMVRWEDYDDISICRRAVGANEGLECYGGYLIYGISGNNNHYIQNTSRATVPKKTHGRLRFSNVYSGFMKVTIVNETTGQTIYNSGVFSNGQVVELPFSETQDQVFSFKEPNNDGGGWRFFSFSGIGVMVLSFDHTYSEKVANLESWSETNCSEI